MRLYHYPALIFLICTPLCFFFSICYSKPRFVLLCPNYFVFFPKKKTNKNACFLDKAKYQEYKTMFEPRDLRLTSCLFNIDPLEINNTRILIIGSKKKVGATLTNILKHKNILYGRIKNRYHINLTNPQMQNLLPLFNFKLIIDLSNDLYVAEMISSLFPDNVAVVRHYTANKHNIHKIEKQNLKGTTIITDKIFQPMFYPNAAHSRELSDLNYFLFDKYFLGNETINVDGDQKYTNHQIVASQIFNCMNVPCPKRIDLRYKSENARTILNNLNPEYIQNIKFYYDNLRTRAKNKIYTSHVSIISENPIVFNRYRAIARAIDKSLAAFYDFCSIEFICVTDIQPNDFPNYFKWIDELPFYKKHLKIISIPLEFIKNIQNKYRIHYFPEYFLRNIGLRRANGTYLLSGSGDVLMPPHFFLGIQKHLFSKNYMLRSNRISVPNETLYAFNFSGHFMTHVKNSFFRNKIVNTLFPNSCNMPCNPQNRNCGDFQGFHRRFWYTINAYYESRENFNIDSLLSYHLLGLYTPIIYKLMYGELHYDHPFVSGNTPGLPTSIYCYPINVKEGEFGVYNGIPNWGHPTSVFTMVEMNSYSLTTNSTIH